MRRAAKRDASEKKIVETLRKAGCSVVIMDKPVDLLIGIEGLNFLAECKTPGTQYGKKLNKNQQDFQDTWKGGAIFILKSVDDALQLVSIIRRRITLPNLIGQQSEHDAARAAA